MTAEQTLMVDPELARQALGDVLEADAAQAPAATPPPLRPRPPDATDEAPWGFKADGTPRKGPPGPGRPRKDPDSQPRTQAASSTPAGSGDTPSPSSAASSEDYSEKINDAITTVWMGAALVPFTRAPAALLKRQAPELIPAWNAAAQQNAKVRAGVLKISGEGSYAWVLPVTVATTPLVVGLWAILRDKQLRAELSAQTERDWAEFLTAATQAAELEAGQGFTPSPDDPASTSSTSSSGSLNGSMSMTGPEAYELG